MDDGISTLLAPERIREEARDDTAWRRPRGSSTAPDLVTNAKVEQPLLQAARGRVASVRGSVIDVAFPGTLPHLNEALRVLDGRRTLILEVQQILGPRTVRTMALGHTDGLARGVAVERTGGVVRVSVGPPTLGRIFNALGEPLDGQAPPAKAERWPIHRQALSTLAIPQRKPFFVETGIKSSTCSPPWPARGPPESSEGLA